MDNKLTQSETQKIPKLRFSGFSNDWEEKKLGDMLAIDRGASPRPISQYITKTEDGVAWIKIGDTIEGLKYIEETKEKITKEGAKKSRKVNIGDFVLSNSMSFGRPYILKIDGCIHDGWLALKNRNKDNLSDDFLYEVLSSEQVRQKFLSLAAGSAVKNLKSETVKTTKISIPNLLEQQKIAKFLGTTDEWIGNLRKQKEFYESYKKGMMQKIFSREIRFKDNKGNEFPKWEEKELGDICEYKNGGSFESKVVEKGKYNLITLNSIDIDGKLKSNHKTVNEADWYLKKDDLIMVLSDVAHGNFLGLVDIIPNNNKYVLNQRMGLLRKKDNEVDLNFLRTYINKKQSYFKLHGQGSSQQNLSKGDILKFKIPIPLLQEQQKIAEFLTSIDEVIESKQQQIIQAEQWKKGLMQRMFV